MRHSVIFWLLLAVSFTSASFPNQEQDTPAESLKEIEEERRALQDKDMKMQRLVEEVLRGRQAFVRVYHDWQRDFRAFKLVSVELTGLWIAYRQIASSYGQVPEYTGLAVVASDQTDEAVAAVVGDFIFAKPYRTNIGGIGIWPQLAYERRYDRLTFNDALGNPMANADVELLLGAGTEKNPRICIGLGKLDEKGELRRPQLCTLLLTHAFVVSRADYGTALAKPPDNLGPRSVDIYTVPIVPIGTVADERTIQGFVLDTENNPVKDARIECRFARTPSGGAISGGQYSRYETITDANGQFAMYLPIDRDTERQDALVPLRAEYHVTVRPPKGLGLRSKSDRIRSGEQTRIILHPAREEGPFRTFLFEDEAGPITDPNRLKNIQLIFKNAKAEGSVVYGKWRDRIRPPVGTYVARMGEGQNQRFLGPIEVTEDSPEVLVFKPHALSRCRGRVIDGITGEPLRGALVTAGRSLKVYADSSEVTPEQWQEIHTLPLNPSLDDPNLTPILNIIHNAEKVVRTDEKGHFEMSLPVGNRRLSMFTFEQHYLCTELGISGSQGAVAPIENITTKLFPAATIIIEPNVPDKVDDRHLKFRYWGDHDIDPAWLDSVVAGERDGRICATATEVLRPQDIRSIHIPAGLDLKFTFHFPTNSKWCPIILRDIKLEQGQTLNLGRQDFQPAIRVLVKIVNSAGEPVPGVTVSHHANGMAWSSGLPISNEKGIASLHVPPNSSGEFAVQYQDGSPEAWHRESMPYEVGGEEDRDRMFTFQLSDRMLSDLFD